MNKNKLFSAALLSTIPFCVMAEYRVVIQPQDREVIKFVNTGENIPDIPVVDNPETCSNNFPTPIMAPGYPQVIKGPGYIQYMIMYTSVGNYANAANMMSQKYPKLLLTYTTGTQHATDYVAYGDTLTGWNVTPGQTIHVIVTPSSYDVAGNVICASGTPIEVVNKTYEQLRNQ